MVQADVAGEPLQHLGQHEIRRPDQGMHLLIPLVRAIPNGLLELVLDEKQPDAGPGADHDDRKQRQSRRSGAE